MRSRYLQSLVLALPVLVSGCTPIGTPGTPIADLSPTPALSPTASRAAGTPGFPGELTFWEEDADDAGVLLDELAAAFVQANPGIKITRVHLPYDDLRNKFRQAVRGEVNEAPPDLVRGPGEYSGPFSELGLVQPLDGLFSPDFLVDYFPGALAGATVRGRLWGIPDNFDHNLLLLFNRSLVQAVPSDTTAWVAQLRTLTDSETGQYGLVYAMTEPYWLAPWLAGFGGWPLDANDRPALDTAEMVEALWFEHDLKFADRVTPENVDYETAYRLFGEGKAAYIIDGRWNLEHYRSLGIDVGIGVLPRVTKTGIVSAPMATGRYWFVRKGIEGEKLDLALRFAEFMTSAPAQETWIAKMGRLPSSKDAAASSVVTGDPDLSAIVSQLRVARAVPPALEMTCAWFGMSNYLREVIAGDLSADKAGPAMQKAADECVREMTVDPTPEAQ